MGTTFYELFTGHHPWKGANKKEVISKILSHKYMPERLPALMRALPKELDAVVERMMRKDESKRYSTMVQVWLDLSNIKTHMI